MSRSLLLRGFPPALHPKATLHFQIYPLPLPCCLSLLFVSCILALSLLINVPIHVCVMLSLWWNLWADHWPPPLARLWNGSSQLLCWISIQITLYFIVYFSCGCLTFLGCCLSHLLVGHGLNDFPLWVFYIPISYEHVLACVCVNRYVVFFCGCRL